MCGWIKKRCNDLTSSAQLKHLKWMFQTMRWICLLILVAEAIVVEFDLLTCVLDSEGIKLGMLKAFKFTNLMRILFEQETAEPLIFQIINISHTNTHEVLQRNWLEIQRNIQLTVSVFPKFSFCVGRHKLNLHKKSGEVRLLLKLSVFHT